MDNLNKSRILSFEDFVSQGLDNQPSVDANIHMDAEPQMGHDQLELPAPAQEPMGHGDSQEGQPDLMMMDEPTNTETEVETDDNAPAHTEEEPSDSDNNELM